MALFGKTPTIHLDIEGMTCGNCVKHVTTALESVAGVKDARVDLDARHAEVRLKQEVDPDRLVAAVAAAGYTAKPAA